jgi:tetratricopeptide (TPR) repeat protein
MNERPIVPAVVFPTEPDAKTIPSLGAAPTPPETNGSTIGPYKLLRQLGEGGMGTIFLAEQQGSTRRRVVLKILKAGANSDQSLAHFQNERQALGKLDHPYIARILDVGSTLSGQPYYVMELVQGIPFTRYCDHQNLSLHERLTLFITVCQAVQHAHDKGVAHRDLKASNILVSLMDRKPVPRVIGFGKVQPTNPDVDARTDVYSLGVLLWELLIGAPPPPGGQLPGPLLPNEQPLKPSVAVSKAEELQNISRRRQLLPKPYLRLLRTDLDWVVLKCLENDQSRRYASAGALAQDVERFLANDTVLARPPSAVYRLRKWLGRHRRPAMVTTALVLLLLAGIAFTTVGLPLLDQALQGSRISNADDPDTLAHMNRLALDYYTAGQPELAAPLWERILARRKVVLGPSHPDTLHTMHWLAAAYSAQGKAHLAVPLLEETLEKRRASLGPNEPDTLTTMYDLASAYQATGKVERAIALYEETLRLRKEHLGPNHIDTANTMHNLATAYQAAGKLDMAVQWFELALEKYRATVGPDHPNTLTTMHWLALAYRASGKVQMAVPLLQRMLEKRQVVLGPDDPATLAAMHDLALVYQETGQAAKAVPLLELTLEKEKRKPGADHPHTLTTMHNLAMAYQAMGRLEQAVPMFELALQKRQAVLGPNHLNTLITMHWLARTCQAAGKLKPAVHWFEETLARCTTTRGPDHADTLASMHWLALAYQADGQADRAVPLFEKLVEHLRLKRGADHSDTVHAMFQLAAAYQAASKFTRAEHLYGEILEKAQKVFGASDARVALALAHLSAILLQQKRHVEAESRLRTCLQIRATQQPNAWTTFHTQALLGASLLGQHKYAEAEPLLLAGFDGMMQRANRIPAPNQVYLSETVVYIVHLYLATGKLEQADLWQRKR